MSTFNIHDNKTVKVNNYEKDVNKYVNGGFTKCPDCTNRNCTIYNICSDDAFDRLDKTKEKIRMKLFNAVIGDNVTLLRELLNEIHVDHPDLWGNTALLFATITDKRESIKELMAHGANPNKCNRRGNSPAKAAREMNIELCSILGVPTVEAL